MPLLDHFHPPLFPGRRWESLHSLWAGEMVNALNGLLPRGYFAECQVHVGSRVEVDAGTFERIPEPRTESGNGGGVAVAVASQIWAPPAATWTWPAVYPDEIEVEIFSTETGSTLVATVELVSPANKDRPETRQAFVAKCASYLSQGIGLLIVDIITSRNVNLHDELVEFLGHAEGRRFSPKAFVYAAAYRPLRRADVEQIEAWPAALALGERLPTLPLAVRGLRCLPVDLEATYTEACRRSKLLE